MGEERLNRKVTVILATDVVGYSKHIEYDESLTIKTYGVRETILLQLIQDFRGRVFNTGGDSVLAEFSSAVDAVECAAMFQARMAEINSMPDTELCLEFRVGINMGDVIQKEGNLLGDGVNIAARLEALAQQGGVSISKSVFDLVGSKTDLTFNDLGIQRIKDNKFHAFDLVFPHSKKRFPSKTARKKVITVMTFACLVLGAILSATFLLSINDNEADDVNAGNLKSIPLILVQPVVVSDTEIKLQKPLTESIISGLSDFRGISVLSSNNSFFISNSNLDDQQIHKLYNVDFIVQASVQTYGEKARINMTLADLKENKVIWSDKLDFTLDEIFKMQDRVNEIILKQIQVDAVAGSIVNDIREYAEDFEFLSLYLNWSAELQKWNPESHKRAQEFLKGMKSFNPDNLLLHNAIGWQIFQRLAFGLSTDLEADIEIMRKQNQLAIETMGRGEDYAQRAMFEYFFFSNSCEAALADVETSLNRGQNVRVHQITGAIYAACGRLEEAVIYNRKALAATPNDIGWFLSVDLVSNLWKLDRYDEIRKVIESKIDADDMDVRILSIFAVVENRDGNNRRAKEMIDRAISKGLTTDQIKNWLRGQPEALKLIDQINEITPF